VLAQEGVNLAKLNPEPPDLDLVVRPPHALDCVRLNGQGLGAALAILHTTIHVAYGIHVQVKRPRLGCCSCHIHYAWPCMWIPFIPVFAVGPFWFQTHTQSHTCGLMLFPPVFAGGPLLVPQVGPRLVPQARIPMPSGMYRPRSPVRYMRSAGSVVNGLGTNFSAVASGRPR
jgi:hypothetical protein